MPRFSERMGLKKVQPIQKESIDESLRSLLWNTSSRFFPGGEMHFSKIDFIAYVTAIFLKIDIEKLLDKKYRAEYNAEKFTQKIKELVFSENCEWHVIYDYLEFQLSILKKIEYSDRVLRKSVLSNSFKNQINDALTRGRSAYRFVGAEIAAITSDKEIAEIEGAQSASGSFSASAEHISQALSLYSERENPDFRNAIKEAISAVEGAARKITGKNKFSDAIDEIKRTYGLHPAQAEGLKRIYGYTSDADGIRHPLKDTDSAVTEADARFMIVICSAFMNYLISLSET